MSAAVFSPALKQHAAEPFSGTAETIFLTGSEKEGPGQIMSVNSRRFMIKNLTHEINCIIIMTFTKTAYS